MRHRVSCLSRGQRKVLEVIRKYPGENSSFYANTLYGDRCRLMETRVSKMMTILEELDFINGSNEPLEHEPCEHCLDSGRMGIGAGFDTADCTYCDANSYECKGCSFKDCRGCNGRFYEGKS